MDKDYWKFSEEQHLLSKFQKVIFFLKIVNFDLNSRPLNFNIFKNPFAHIIFYWPGTRKPPARLKIGSKFFYHIVKCHPNMYM